MAHMAQQQGTVLFVLLLGCMYVRGAPVTTGAYSGCDAATCKPPSCLCPANNPPGGLTTDQIPQFVLISHDNALDGLPYDLMMKLIGSKTQANGCPVPVTWFAMRYHSNCENGQMALARGDEVAMQANRFFPSDPFNATDPNPNYDSRDPATGKPSVEREITMSREWWNEKCGLPLHDMVGFRAQGYYNNALIREVLARNGWLYDATLPERYYAGSPTSPSLDQMLWPYSMDAGIPQECKFWGTEIGKCSVEEKYPGLWEVPLYFLQDGETLYGASDYGNTELEGMPEIEDMDAFLRDQLDQHLGGGRTPLEINTYYEWLSEKPEELPAADPQCIFCVRAPSQNGLALASLVDYAVTKPEVRFITYSDLVRWMQDPVPLDQFDDWVQCKVPGVKADLSATNLSAADKAGAFYLEAGAAAMAGTPASGPEATEEGEEAAAEIPSHAPEEADEAVVESPAASPSQGRHLMSAP